MTPTHCTNCNASPPPDPGSFLPALPCYSLDHKRAFCRECAGIAEALGIGARLPAFLYESGNAATTGAGQVMGAIVHKRAPEWSPGRRRAFSAVRFRVKMLDGSMWHGTGPTQNGNYIRLRPMKGA